MAPVLLACWAGHGGCGGAGSGGGVIGGHRGWLFRSGCRVCPGRILVAVVGLVRVGQLAGRVAGWLREVSCLFLYFCFLYVLHFIIF